MFFEKNQNKISKWKEHPGTSDDEKNENLNKIWPDHFLEWDLILTQINQLFEVEEKNEWKLIYCTGQKWNKINAGINYF